MVQKHVFEYFTQCSAKNEYSAVAVNKPKHPLKSLFFDM